MNVLGVSSVSFGSGQNSMIKAAKGIAGAAQTVAEKNFEILSDARFLRKIINPKVDDAAIAELIKGRGIDPQANKAIVDKLIAMREGNVLGSNIKSLLYPKPDQGLELSGHYYPVINLRMPDQLRKGSLLP